jgi:hypothetical protein
MPAKSSEPQQIYQLKVTLKDYRPPIWRRLQVPSTITLGKLHRILQDAMGWTDSHLHSFLINGVEYGQPMPEYDLDIRSERSVKLSQVVTGEKFKFVYLYDMGDGWEHEVLVEKVLPPEPIRYPICLTGKRACPPEDCGGVGGYAEFLNAIQNPDHPEHEMMRDWIGGDFDPEEFDLDAVNALLRKIR